MDKKESLAIIYDCAKRYKENLAGRTLMFVYMDKHKRIGCLEVSFDASNFQHLTGIETQELTSREFYRCCIDKRLGMGQFKLSAKGTTVLKLQVLPMLVKPDMSANMLGNYDVMRPKLYTEKLTGNIKGCMGFVKGKGERYVPNTVLKEDIRDVSVKTARIILTCRKDKEDKEYKEIVYKAKNVAWDDIIQKLNRNDIVRLIGKI